MEYINFCSHRHAVTYLIYVAKLLCDFLHSESLLVEETKGGHFCMSQYSKLMSHCRIPGKEVDSHQITPIENSRHIIVMHNDHVSVIL